MTLGGIFKVGYQTRDVRWDIYRWDFKHVTLGGIFKVGYQTRDVRWDIYIGGISNT